MTRATQPLHKLAMQIQVEIPPDVARSAGLDSASPSRTVQGMLALLLYEHGKLSLGKACEWGQMSQWEFMDQAKAMGVQIDGARDMARSGCSGPRAQWRRRNPERQLDRRDRSARHAGS